MANLLRRRSRALVPLTRAVPSVAATSVKSYTSGVGQPMLAEWNAPAAIKEAYLANVWVYASARAVAQDVASRPFRMGADPNRKQDYNLNHRLAKMLGPAPGGPAKGISSAQLIEWSVIQRLITGRWAWERVNDPVLGVASLWPLPASNLSAIASTAPQTWWAGFVLNANTAQRRDLRADQVAYGWKPSQEDWRQPESVLQAARLDISVAVMQDRYDYHFLKNDARPAALIVHEAFEDPAQQVKFRRQFYAEHRGPQNAGRPMFVKTKPGGAETGKSVDVIPLGFNQRDAAFIERYEAKIKAILVAFGVPMTRLMDASNRTFSNAGEESKGYWNVTVKEVAAELAAMINTELSPIWGSDIGWFDFTEIDKLLSVPRFNPYQGAALVKAGVLLRDEVREELGLKPTAQLEPAQVAELDNAYELSLAPKAGGGAPAALSAPEGETRHQTLVINGPVTRDALPVGSLDVVDRPKPPTPTVTPHDRRRAQYRAVAAGVNTLEKQWERRVQALLNRQQRAVLERLDGKRARQATRSAQPSAENLFNAKYWRDETKSMGEDLYESVMGLSGAAAAKELGVDFDLTSKYALDFIDKRANKLAGHLTDTTYEGIKDELVEGVAAGESIDDIAARIKGLFEQTYKGRARTVARTEVISSYNGSTAAVAAEYGDLVDGLEWISTHDAHTRASHNEADGQTTKVGEPFNVGGAELAYPGDPDGPAEEVVNCRCTTAMIVGDGRQAKRHVPLAAVEAAAIRVARGEELSVVLGELTAA